MFVTKMSCASVSGVLMFIFAISTTYQGRSQSFSDTGQVVTFKGNKVVLRLTGKKDSLFIKDPITGEMVIKTVPIYVPIKISSTNIIQRLNYQSISHQYEKVIIDRLAKSKILTALPNGKVVIGLNNIVLTPDGKVGYYNLYRETFEGKDEMIRTLDLEREIDKIVEQTIKVSKDKLDNKYVLLEINLAKYNFYVYNGSVSAKLR